MSRIEHTVVRDPSVRIECAVGLILEDRSELEPSILRPDRRESVIDRPLDPDRLPAREEGEFFFGSRFLVEDEDQEVFDLFTLGALAGNASRPELNIISRPVCGPE